jgi:GcrA cell cycle regulator
MSPNKNSPRSLRHDDLVIPLKQRKSVVTLLPGDCRWPIGDPRHKDFHFCGKQKVDGHPYCKFHMRQGFQPARALRPLYGPKIVA